MPAHKPYAIIPLKAIAAAGMTVYIPYRLVGMYDIRGTSLHHKSVTLNYQKFSGKKTFRYSGY
jgi:hypothetical protein